MRTPLRMLSISSAVSLVMSIAREPSPTSLVPAAMVSTTLPPLPAASAARIAWPACFAPGTAGRATAVAASKAPDIKRYAVESGVKATDARPRPIVQADPSMVPRYRRARSACKSLARPPTKKPSPASVSLAISDPRSVEMKNPPTDGLSLKSCEAAFCTKSVGKLSAAKP